MPDKVVQQNGNSNVVVATSPAEVPLPAAYVKLGLTMGYNPRGIEDARIYLTGLAGEGKSTFVRGIPDAWTLDFEGGSNGVPGARGAYFDLPELARNAKKDAYEIYSGILTQLIADGKAGKRPCRRIIIDTHDAWVDLEGRHLLQEKSSGVKVYEDIGEIGMKGHGHSLLQGRCKKVIGMLEDAGYAWCIVGHLGYTSTTDPVTFQESTKIRPLLSKGYVGPVVRSAELHITINSSTRVEKVDKEVNGRVFKGADEKEITRYHIYTRPTEAKAMEGKRRAVPQLPAKMEVPMVGGWDVLVAAYNQAVEESRTIDGEVK